MANLTKKIFFIIFIVVCILICKSTTVFASEQEVLINGATDNIYSTNVGDSAIFDNTTNTLTLNNYNGGHILFNGFEDGDEIKINLKGTNKIEEPAVDSPTVSGIEVSTTDTNAVDLIFSSEDNGSLEINNFRNGIYVVYGDITLDKACINTDNNSYVGIYTVNGNIDINNSKLDIKNSRYNIAADNANTNCELNDSEISLANAYEGLYFYGNDCGFIINNCKINIDGISDAGIYCFAAKECTINNCKVNVTNTDYPIYCCCDTKIENGTEITMNTVYEGIYGYNLNFINSKIDMKDVVYAIDCWGSMIFKNIELNIDNTTYTYFDCGEYYSSYGIESYYDKVEFIDSIVTMNNVDYGIYVWAPLVFNGGTTTINANILGIYDESEDETQNNYIEFKDGKVYINTNDGVAICNNNTVIADSEDIIINDKLKIEEPGLYIRKYEVEGEYYSTIGEDVDPSEVNDESSFMSNAASKVSIIPNTTVSFNGNGANGTMADVNINGKYILPENEFEVPANKKFVGWSLSASGDSIITEIDVSEDITIYAIWKDIEYTVTFNSNGGSTVESKTVVQNSKVEQPANPTKENYTFEGWYTDEDLTSKYDFSSPITKNITLYAKWNEVKPSEDPVSYTYKFESGEAQTFIIDCIANYTFTIDGDYNKFVGLTIGNIELERDVDYKAESGSTIITLLQSGLDKLNQLEVGQYDVIVKFEEEEVKGSLTIKNKDEDEDKGVDEENNNPETGDYIMYILIAFAISGIGLFVVTSKMKKLKK